MNALDKREFRRILLIKPSSPGDIIHALPVLHGLRKRYPLAKLDWLVATAFVDFVAVDPAVDEIVPFDRKRFGTVGRGFGATREFVSFLAALRSRSYDLVVDLQGLFRSGFMAFVTGADVRLGFADARELAPIFYTHKIRAPRGDLHAADRNFAVAPMLGFGDAEMDFSVTTTNQDRTRASRLLAEADIESEEPFALLVPSTRWETKCWPPERFGELAVVIRERFDMKSVLVGGESDRDAGNAAAAAAAGSAVSLCGRTTLRELASLIESAAVVVTADSMPMHLAAALGRPLVALFGPTNPARTGPHGRIEDVLRIEDLACSPCYFRRLRQCPHDHACMLRLEVETVAEAVGRRLGPRMQISAGDAKC